MSFREIGPRDDQLCRAHTQSYHQNCIFPLLPLPFCHSHTLWNVSISLKSKFYAILSENRGPIIARVRHVFGCHSVNFHVYRSAKILSRIVCESCITPNRKAEKLEPQLGKLTKISPVQKVDPKVKAVLSQQLFSEIQHRGCRHLT